MYAKVLENLKWCPSRDQKGFNANCGPNAELFLFSLSEILCSIAMLARVVYLFKRGKLMDQHSELSESLYQDLTKTELFVPQKWKTKRLTWATIFIRIFRTGVTSQPSKLLLGIGELM